MDLDAIWGGEWGWSRDGCITCGIVGGDRRRGKGSFRVNVGHPIVTNWDLWHIYSLP